jgi:hypothetical protein
MDNCPYCDRPLAGGICPVHLTVDRPQAPQATFVQGMIIMWSGAIANIPAGWALCDGTNGAPDLRDRFVCGAGGGNAVGATGGSNADHSHSYVAVSVSGDISATSGNESSHTHGGDITSTGYADLGGPSGTFQVASGTNYYVGSGSHDHADAGHTHSGGTTGTGSAHNHSVSGTFSGSGSGSTGGSNIGTNAPAYYALALIMKL